jgi:hypothetical protein
MLKRKCYDEHDTNFYHDVDNSLDHQLQVSPRCVDLNVSLDHSEHLWTNDDSSVKLSISHEDSFSVACDIYMEFIPLRLQKQPQSLHSPKGK